MHPQDTPDQARAATTETGATTSLHPINTGDAERPDSHALSIAHASLGVSMAALVVALFAGYQAYRAAGASERQSLIAEEQVRPRLVFEDPTATLTTTDMVFAITLRNTGTVPAHVLNVKIALDSTNGYSAFERTLDNATNAVLYAGSSRVVSCSLPRWFAVDVGKAPVDYSANTPSLFDFSVEYQVFGKPSFGFSEALRFPNLEWKLK